MSDKPMTAAPSAPLSEVEWRVDGKPNERNGNWSSRFVPYLDAATVAGMLDEWVPFRWQDSYEPGTIDGKFVLWCHLDIDRGDRWIRRSDVGKPSQWEAEKGCVSDAFKRAACLKWGVGRNVYDLPTLWAPCDTYRNGKGETVAKPNGSTLPALQEQLRKLGYTVDGGRVQTDPPEGVDPITGEVNTGPAEPPTTVKSGAKSCVLCDTTLAGHNAKRTPDGLVHADGCPVGPGTEAAA